ncbi:uncharacterized protein [Hetaerina americana]|uniref:uncharacterized protein n=1 Tax=Hetaerina americana TaxID=62018 RepID=UPI003A7F5169
MSQQINGVVGGDAHKGTTKEDKSFELEINKIPLSAVGNVCSTAEMASGEDTGRERHGSEAEVCVKLEICGGGRSHGSEVSDDSGALVKNENDLDIEHEGKIKSRANVAECADVMSARGVNASLGADVGGNNVIEPFSDGNFDRECSGDSERANVYGTPLSGLVQSGRKRSVGRPKGKRGAGRGNLSFEHYQSEDANSPGGFDFRGTDVGTPLHGESGRGEKRKRGRPRGSRASGRIANSFEGKYLDDVYSGASDSGDTEATGSNLSDSGLGGGVTSPHPVAIIKVARGALRPGCKSYRGRAASMGRGFRASYGGDTASTWDVDTGVVPMEYESALSPTSGAEVLGKRRLSLPDHLTPSPRSKVGRGSRGRSRGRPRGRRPRPSYDHDFSIDNDSSDPGTPGLDSPAIGTPDVESPEGLSARTESDPDTPISPGKSRRGRGRGSRGGRGSSGTPSGSKTPEDKIITCGVCKESMTQTMFAYHRLRVHNCCAWREGIDSPLDLTNDKVIKPLLKQALQKRKQLTCEKCGITRSSLVGFESHLTFCAKSEGERDALMETCPVCSRRMMPSSLKVHMGVHRQEEKSKQSLGNLDGSLENPFDPGEGSSTSTGKIKRAAANRAVSLMQSVIKGEDLEVEEVPKKKALLSLELEEMYEKNKEGAAEIDGEASGKEGVGIAPSLYQVAAWMRIVQRHGKANCKNSGCSFSSTLKDELIQHFKNCDFRPKISFLCKICSFGSGEEAVMRKHVKSVHMGEKDGEEAVESMSESDSGGSMAETECDSNELDGEEDADQLAGSLEASKVKKKKGRKKKIEKKMKEESKDKKGKPKEEEGKTPKTIKYTKNIDFLAKHGLYRRSGLQAYIATLRWNLDFQLSNYSFLPLYTEWRTFAKDWVRVSGEEVNAYLPKARDSPQFARLEINSENCKPELIKKKPLPSFNRLPLFGASFKSSGDKKSQPGFITMFAGGPVWAQAWCPTPLFINCLSPNEEGDSSRRESCATISQFLAVSCNPDFDGYHPLESRVQGEKFIIQIWDCGPLSNIENDELMSPIMALGIAHEFGPVWALEWCPSGCYDVDMESGSAHESEMSDGETQPLPSGKPLRRLGVLAAACGDGTIRIFSVPFPSELSKAESAEEPCRQESRLSDTDANCVTKTTQGKGGRKKVNPLNRTANGDDSVDDDGDEMCVEVEERIGNNKSITSSKGKPGSLEPTNQSAFSSSGMPQSEIKSSEKSGSKDIASGLSEPLPIFKPSSVITLVVNSCSPDKESENWQCLCLSWSLLGKSHSVLAAGFSNGLIALWDLRTSSPLLRVERVQEDGSLSLFLRPYHMFFGHKNSVTALVLASCTPEEKSQTGEKYPRYLVSGSRDRLLKVWDLQDTAAPLSSYPRGLVTSVTWLTNWISFVSSIDDSFACGRANSKAQALRQYGYKPSPMLSQNSPVMSVVCSDWLNTIAHGTNAGEACILAAQQMLLAVESSKVIKHRKAFVYYTELIDLMEGKEGVKSIPKESKGDKTVDIGATSTLEGQVPPNEEPDNSNKHIVSGIKEEGRNEKVKKEKSKPGKRRGEKANADPNGNDAMVMESEDECGADSNEANNSEFQESPRTYTEVTEKFGLLFCDLAVDQEVGRLPKEALGPLQQTERMRTIPVDLYPISAINKMCWNPNMQSFIWLASGHQSGLVRLCRVQRTRNRIVEIFEGNAQKKIKQVFTQRTGYSS